jgi:HAD superfamily hydrolase (TIGR01484 family)
MPKGENMGEHRREYKLIALDMDGTVLNSEHQISDMTRQWIYAAMERGITVSFSTGRGISNVLPYIEQLGIKTPIVTVNGSEVWKEPHVLLRRTLMELDAVKEMYRIAVEYDTWYWAYSVEGVFNKEHWTNDLDSQEWLKFGYHTEDDAVRSKILQTLSSWGTLEITNSSPYNLEINPLGMNKASGVGEVCELLGIDMSQVVAVGDSLNDISMIRAAGLGVAMGNAQDQVKQAADAVTGTNDEDGVAQVIRDYVLRA